jgi:hypothetical protein
MVALKFLIAKNKQDNYQVAVNWKKSGVSLPGKRE